MICCALIPRIYIQWQVLLLVKGALLEDPRPIYDDEEERKNPMGLLHVTALRLADIFSDDSNFRNLVMDHIVCGRNIYLSWIDSYTFRYLLLGLV